MTQRLSFIGMAGAVSLALIGCAGPTEVTFDESSSSSARTSLAPRSSESVVGSAIAVSSVAAQSSKQAASQAAVQSSKPAAVTQIPATVALAVPFAPQAPFGNWDPPYDEACEEASLILADAFLKGKTSVSLEDMDKGINATVAWETQNGMPIDITMAQLKTVAEQKYGLKARLIDNPTVDDIKKELAAGNPVILPLAGRDIGNPYFSGEGPWYHVLVVSGYDGKNFITQDVGTKRGANYKYRYDVLMSAIHDWTGIKEEIHTGKRVVLVVES